MTLSVLKMDSKRWQCRPSPSKSIKFLVVTGRMSESMERKSLFSRKEIDIMPTKEEFEAYERVRRSGKWNMFTQAREAAEDAELSFERYRLVLLNYEGCMLRYA